MPLGDRRVIDVISERLSGIADQAAVIVPTFPYDDAYEAAIRRSDFSDVQIIHHDPLGDWATDYETSDYVVFLDAALWPSESIDVLGDVASYARFAGATHVVAVGAPAELRHRERVEQDELGRVRRVQRYYARTAGSDAGAPSVLLTVAPARSLIGVPLRSLGRVRSDLAHRGVLTRDLPVPSDVLDLAQESAALSLNDHALRRLEGHRRGSVGVVVTGARTRVHPTARLIGPVVLQSDVVVEERAAIIGPTVIGAGARIGRGAIVAHSVVLQSAQVADNTWVRQAVTGSVRTADPQGSEAPAPDAEIRDDLMPTLQLEPMQPDRWFSAGLKRAVDVSLAILGLVASSPVLLVIAILIKLDSPGRVFFAHRREGKDGKEFSCIKFRTMVEGAHRQQRGLYKFNEVDGPQFKMDRDPRETRLGRWLRARSLDEVPQLINVIRGEMSLVGPRPSPFRENQVCVPWRRARLSVRPGITGLWQLCRGNRSSGDFHEWVYYDILYVRHRSIWLDLKILVGTIITLGGRRSLPVTWLIRDAERDGARPAPVAA